MRVQWTHTQDLHITLGFIGQVKEEDLRGIAIGMAGIAQFSRFMANGEDIKLYGNAIVLRVEPYQTFYKIHKKLNQKLMELSQNQYQFQVRNRFDAHLTIGRLRNLSVLNPLHKQQFLNLIQEQFRSVAFLIQQAALLCRSSETTTPAYQSIQLYSLKG